MTFFGCFAERMKTKMNIQISKTDKKADVCRVTDNAISKLCAGRQLKHKNECIETKKLEVGEPDLECYCTPR